MGIASNSKVKALNIDPQWQEPCSLNHIVWSYSNEDCCIQPEGDKHGLAFKHKVSSQNAHKFLTHSDCNCILSGCVY